MIMIPVYLYGLLVLTSVTAATPFFQQHPQYDETVEFGNYYNYWKYSESTGFDLTRGNSNNTKTIASGTKGPIHISPANSALVIIDMQNYFLNPDYTSSNFSAGLEAVQPTVDAVHAFRAAGAKVIWCQWGLNAYDLLNIGPSYKYGFADSTGVNGTKNPAASVGSEMGEFGGVDYGKKLTEGYYNTEPYGPLLALAEEGIAAGTDVYFPKNRQSCLWGAQTPMGIWTEANEISTLFFSGVNIDQCVYGSFNDAYYKGYDAIVVQDASATTSPAYATEMVLYNANYKPDMRASNLTASIMTSIQANAFNITLESECVKLVPFEISKHLQPFIDASPDLYEYMVIGPWSSEEDFRAEIWTPYVEPNKLYLFAVYDKTKAAEDGLAGIIGYLQPSFTQLSTEIAAIVVLPQFQRTHVTSNAIGILMQYALNLPSDPKMPGLGFRRLSWTASNANEKSVGAAKRMGFQVEGITRWAWVLSEADAKQWNGKLPREGDPKGETHLGRDSVILSVCWDDWEGGVRELVHGKMDRQ